MTKPKGFITKKQDINKRIIKLTNEITNFFNDLMQSEQIEYWNIILNSTIKNIPNLFFIKNGITYFIKIDFEQPSDIQRIIIKKMNKIRKIVFVVKGIYAVKKIYEEVSN